MALSVYIGNVSLSNSNLTSGSQPRRVSQGWPGGRLLYVGRDRYEGNIVRVSEVVCSSQSVVLSVTFFEVCN